MIVKIGEICLCYDWVKASEKQCRNCKGFGGVFKEGIDCKYSQVPNREPKYHVGERRYYHEYHNIISYEKIRKIDWDGFTWQYTFARKRTSAPEDRVYATRREGEEKELKDKARSLYDELMSFKERYGTLPNVELLKLEQKNYENN